MDDHSHSRAERFLSAFNQVEELLQHLAGGNGHAPFISLLDSMARRHPTVRQYYSELTQYARLRNIMVHTMRDGYYMAEPHEQAVALLESIVEQLSHPPIVADFMTPRPFSVRTTDALSVVVDAFPEGTPSPTSYRCSKRASRAESIYSVSWSPQVAAHSRHSWESSHRPIYPSSTNEKLFLQGSGSRPLPPTPVPLLPLAKRCTAYPRKSV